MTAIDAYLADLARALHATGRARRRFLRECRDHLADAADAAGEQAAIEAFGSAAEVAAAFDAEVAHHRGARATAASVAGVLATGGSTLVLIDGAAPGSSTPVGLALAFFVCAQVAGVAIVLALLQALGVRARTAGAAELALLVRRDACALVAAGLTMLLAGIALPGQGSATALLAGPVLVCGAGTLVLRARRLTRRLAGSRERVTSWPLGPRMVDLDPRELLGATVAVAGAAAFWWDRGEQGTYVHALATAGVEATAVVACFLLLGPALGLRRRHRQRARGEVA